MNFPIDSAFLVRLQANERMAVQQFVDLYAGTLYLLILFVVDDKTNAEKILHYALRAALVNIQSYNPQKEGLFLWLLKQTITQIDIDRNIVIEKFQLLMQSFDKSPYIP